MRRCSVTHPEMEMEEVKRRLICTTKVDDVPEELIHRIQSLLPVEEAGRTCVLSKSWLHAWSTIPTLRFHQSKKVITKKQRTRYRKLIDRTLTRYLQDNIPIISFDLHFEIHNPKSVSRAEKWIRTISSKSCLKELHLKIFVNIASSFTFPDEIFSGEHLNTISVTNCSGIKSLRISSNPVIKCVNLRVLNLLCVRISEEVLDKLLSTCSLLEKAHLKFPKGLKVIKVRNLRYLRELKIESLGRNNVLEIYNVPSLSFLFYDISLAFQRNPPSFNMDLLGSVRDLYLEGVTIDDAFSNIIKSTFPFLESLNLKMERCKAEILDITCVSLRILKIRLSENMQLDIQVNAPKLLFFCYEGSTMPSLLFPVIAPKQINLSLELENPIDTSFFLKMRETLDLSSNFKIKFISADSVLPVPFNANIDDVRTRVLFPATNVEQIRLEKYSSKGLWEHQQFLDAVFSICHPKYVSADQGRVSYMSREWLINRMMKLNNVEIKNPFNGKWETLTSYKWADVFWSYLNFKLTWCSS